MLMGWQCGTMAEWALAKCGHGTVVLHAHDVAALLYYHAKCEHGTVVLHAHGIADCATTQNVLTVRL
eukprot:1151602-Pelagomonas_calceolata.AAC.6